MTPQYLCQRPSFLPLWSNRAEGCARRALRCAFAWAFASIPGPSRCPRSEPRFPNGMLWLRPFSRSKELTRLASTHGSAQTSSSSPSSLDALRHEGAPERGRGSGVWLCQALPGCAEASASAVIWNHHCRSSLFNCSCAVYLRPWSISKSDTVLFTSYLCNAYCAHLHAYAIYTHFPPQKREKSGSERWNVSEHCCKTMP